MVFIGSSVLRFFDLFNFETSKHKARRTREYHSWFLKDSHWIVKQPIFQFLKVTKKRQIKYCNFLSFIKLVACFLHVVQSGWLNLSRLSRGLFVPETPFHNISRMFGLGFDRVHTGQSQHTSLLILDPGPHTWLGVGPSYFKHQAYSCPQGELSASMLPLRSGLRASFKICCVVSLARY